MNRIKIIIKADGVKLKTDDVRLAIQALERLEDRQSVPAMLKPFFSGIGKDEETDEDFPKGSIDFHITKTTKLNPDGTLPELVENIKEKKEKKFNKIHVAKRPDGTKMYNNGIYKAWTGEEKGLIEDLVRQDYPNKKIAENPFLLKNHTRSAILTKTSSIRNGR